MKWLISLLFVGSVSANYCELGFTDEQSNLVNIGIAVGSQYDPELNEVINDTIGYTVAAIIWQESFVGRYVIRQNTKDGESGSWGVMHVQLTTYLYMNNIDDTWETKQDIYPEVISKFIKDDFFAVRQGYKYLREMIIQSGSLWRGVVRYNGAGPRAEEYMQKIQHKVNKLMRCRF